MTAHPPRATSLLCTAAVFALLSGAGASGGRAQTARLEVIIHADTTHAPISPWLCGQFLEHIGGIINRGVWAEMLDDRKFYAPIVPTEPPQAQPGPRSARRWTAVGPITGVTMDSGLALVGAHSPRITLDAAEPRGIRQAGLTVEEGESYVGRVMLAADGDARVTVTPAWGADPAARQTVTIDLLSRDYVTYPLSFTAGADAADAQLEFSAADSRWCRRTRGRSMRCSATHASIKWRTSRSPRHC
jgi:alpha-N-arabinofuranosidase